MRVGFIGMGRLGLPIAAILSQHHQVTGYDPDPTTGQRLKIGHPWEEGLDEYLNDSIALAPSIDAATHDAEVIVVCVQTPHHPELDGTHPDTGIREPFDLSYVEAAFAEIESDAPVVLMSTVLPGDCRKLADLIPGDLIYSPAFPAMGTTVRDVLDPEFVLSGTKDGAVPPSVIEQLWQPALWQFKHYHGTWETIELAKVSYNTLVGMKLAASNTIGWLADKTGADGQRVMHILKQADRRIVSTAYMNPGLGDGGACFPPDEIVITRHGPKPISTVKVGDEVLTIDGTLQHVYATSSRHYEGDLVGVRSTGLPWTWMTPEHPVIAREDLRKRRADGRRRTDIFPKSEAEETRADDLRAGQHLTIWPNSEAAVALPDRVTPEYLELAGWYLSEGSMTLKRTSGRLRFDLHLEEVEESERIAELLAICIPPRTTGRGANAKIAIELKPSQTRRSVRAGTLALSQQLYMDFGKGAADKVLPDWVLWGDDKTVALVLEGMLKGDGHIKKGVSFSTVSPHLAWGAQVMMTRLGCVPSLRVVDRPNRLRSYEVRVRNRAQARHLFAQVNIATRPSGAHEVRTEPWRQVREIRRKAYVGSVHNLSVEGTNTFVTGVGAVHNCHPRDNIAMSWLAQEHGVYDLFTDLIRQRESHSAWIARIADELAYRHDLGVVILGREYKANSTLTDGSPPRLMANQMGWRIVDDPKEIERHSVVVIGVAHDRFRHLELPAGSVVVDPFGVVESNATVVRPGRA